MTIKTYQILDKRLYKQEISNYVNGLPIGETYRNEILDEKFIDENLLLYTYYPYLFSDSLKIGGKVKQLNIAGFIYYKSIIYFDELLDNNRHDEKSLIFITLCQEESIKLLTSLFPIESEFWIIWNKRRQEYFKGYYLDYNSDEIRSYEDFEALADYKSSFGKVSIDSLYLLSSEKNESLYSSLLDSHKYFYVALQIMDDLNDLREDLVNGQFNIAMFELKKELSNRKINYSKCSVEVLSKYLYVFGIAERLFDKCLIYIEKSRNCVTEFDDLNKWRIELDALNNQVVTKKLNVQAFLYMSQVEFKLSIKNRTQFNNINKGIDFLKRAQNTDGSWNEFFNDAGMSDTWATAYLVSFLSQRNVSNSQIELLVKSGKRFLHGAKNGDLWGYNRCWIPDADSTSFTLLALYNNIGKGDIRLSLNQWVKYQNSDGGFATYKSENDILSSLNSNVSPKDVVGWTNSHLCVSVAAFYFLAVTRNDSSSFNKLEKYIVKNVNTHGLWDAYWWTSPIYSTSFMIKSVAYIQNEYLLKLIDNSVNQIIRLQNKNGSFGDKYVTNSPFYTGLVIDAICEIPKYFNMFKSQIDNAVDWLKSSQMDDGSWVATSAMRMPDSKITDPSVILEWPEDTKGLNIRAKEFNRLFSTVVSVSALLKYDKISKK